jgi:N-formylglutamate amidohydrolase
MKKMTQTHLAYTINAPKAVESAFVFASPHSGRHYSESFLRQSILDEKTIRSSEDAYVDTLCDFIPDLGAPFLCATAPRAFLDLNRGVDELDPAVINGIKTKGHNARVASGLGVIPKVVAHSQPIYSGKISAQDAQNRIDQFWVPYHTALANLLAQAKDRFGYAILVDLHSMPHDAVACPVKSVSPIHIVLGDRFGASCERSISDHIARCLQQSGLRVGRNAPFAGAYIAQNYGRPSQNQHALQIEIDRALYLDEEDIRTNDNFGALRAQLKTAIELMLRLDQADVDLAAE